MSRADQKTLLELKSNIEVTRLGFLDRHEYANTARNDVLHDGLELLQPHDVSGVGIFGVPATASGLSPH